MVNLNHFQKALEVVFITFKLILDYPFIMSRLLNYKSTLFVTICLLNCITKGAGQNWSQVGNGGMGLGNGVTVLFSDTSSDLLIAGGPLWADNNSDTISGIAAWNGNNWDSLGAGFLNHTVDVIIGYNSNIIVGGYFTNAGGVPANKIALWNGISWEALEGGTDNTVHDMNIYDDKLIVVGFFGNANGIPVNSLATWNGLTWDTLPKIPPGFVRIRTVEVFNNELYIGGEIELFSSLKSPHIIKWNGVEWQPVGSGLPDGNLMDPVYDLQVFDSKLYIGGPFYNEWNYPGIVYWDEVEFNDPGGGVDGYILDMAIFNDTLYAVGAFNYAGGISANNIAKWDGSNWCSLGSSFNGQIMAIEVHNGELYISGQFSSIDGSPINNVAKWIGGNYVEQCGNTTSTELIKSIELQVYPNPSQNLANINFLHNIDEVMKVEILDILGHQVFVHNFSVISGSNIYTVSLETLPTGLYFLRLIGKSSSYHIKIIKE